MILAVKPGFGQTSNPIDEQLNTCLEDSLTTSGMINCALAAYQAWDQELNKYYKLLLTQLKDENKKLLTEAQRRWINYRDEEFKLIDAYYFSEMEGTMWIPVATGEKANIVKGRTLKLQQYYEELNAMKE